jgi:DNA-binding IclR family transcriptional regulator
VYAIFLTILSILLRIRNKVPKKGTTETAVSALSSSIEILRCFSQSKPELSFADIIVATGRPKSSVSRVLRALRDCRLIEQDAHTRRYRPGLLTFELGRLYRTQDDMISLVEVHLRKVCERTGHTGYIAILDGIGQVVLRMVPGSNPLRVVSPPGQRTQAMLTSNGRAMLARLSDAEIRARVPEPFPQFPANGPQSFDELMARLREIRRTLTSTSENESIDGVASQGFSLANSETGEMIGIAISYSSQGTPPEERAQVGRALRTMAQHLAPLVGDKLWMNCALAERLPA